MTKTKTKTKHKKHKFTLKYFKSLKTNKTKKILPSECPISLKPLEPLKDKIIKISSKTEKKNKQKFVKTLLSDFSPKHIKAKDDFYDYINYTWLKNIKIKESQKYIIEVDEFRLTQDKVYNELNEIILDYIKNNNDTLSKNLKHFYNSVIKMTTKLDTQHLAKKYVNIVDSFINQNNYYALLGYINNFDMISPFAPLVWTIMPDDKNVKFFASNVTTHSFFILDLDVYFDDGTNVEYKKKYRNEFSKYVKNVFDSLLGKNHNLNPNDIFDVEVEMINAFSCRNIKNNINLYNKVYTKDSLSKYGFDWHEFAKHLGFKKTPDFFITNSLPYLKCINKVLTKQWTTPKWRTYWIFLFLRFLTRITDDLEDITYNFFGKFERGQEKINKANSVSASLYMSIPFNNFLTTEYVKKYENPAIMKYTSILCDDLKATFNNILKRNTWMSPSTKKYALKKLKHFSFIYGKPDKILEDPNIVYTDNLYDNLIKLMEWRHNKFIQLEGDKVVELPIMDWTQYPVKMTGSQAYIVNASYTPARNGIYINLGYLQKPFVDLHERGIEYNLAHLGNTLAHEMSHGFDNNGRLYGYDGNLYDWWTKEDIKKYKVMQDDVVKQYETYALRDKIKFDATIGLGEDLADISAVGICDEYLRHFQDNGNEIIPVKRLSYELYYIYLAIQQRQHINKKAISAQLKTNPHPLDKYRCNVPISRSDIFRGLHNIKKGDGMWWHNTNSIW